MTPKISEIVLCGVGPVGEHSCCVITILQPRFDAHCEALGLHDIDEVSARFESRNANPGHERRATRHVGSSSSINGSSGIKDDTTLLDYVLLLTVQGADASHGEM